MVSRFYFCEGDDLVEFPVLGSLKIKIHYGGVENDAGIGHIWSQEGRKHVIEVVIVGSDIEEGAR